MDFIKKIVPEVLLKAIRPYYHGLLTLLASVYYGHPGDKLVVIGITGTAGKSTTAIILSSILNASGKKTGYITTVAFFDGKQEFFNKHGLSMPSGPILQKSLQQMFQQHCQYAIIETTSEGLAQNRHLGINFDVALFTNLSSAHIEAHGGFEKYKEAKRKLFQALEASSEKKIFGGKIIGVNLDDDFANDFLQFKASKKFGVIAQQFLDRPEINSLYTISGILNQFPLRFSLNSVAFSMPLIGEFNVKNASLALACADMLGVNLQDSAKALSQISKIRGRMEQVENDFGFRIFVDYGCEPVSISSALKAASELPHKRLIHVFGSTGGHRDVAKRFYFGEISAQYADISIITNDDVYNSNPEEIASNIVSGIKKDLLYKGQYEIILDRRQAIAKALAIAQKEDVVLITGKGSEQFLILPGNKRIVWDDGQTVREELAKLSK